MSNQRIHFLNNIDLLILYIYSANIYHFANFKQIHFSNQQINTIYIIYYLLFFANILLIFAKY